MYCWFISLKYHDECLQIGHWRYEKTNLKKDEDKDNSNEKYVQKQLVPAMVLKADVLSSLPMQETFF